MEVQGVKLIAAAPKMMSFAYNLSALMVVQEAKLIAAVQTNQSSVPWICALMEVQEAQLIAVAPYMIPFAQKISAGILLSEILRIAVAHPCKDANITANQVLNIWLRATLARLRLVKAYFVAQISY